MAFTELYCNPVTGNNMNGGSDENANPSYTFVNGGWVSTTGVYTPTSGNPSSSGVAVGQLACIFLDGATTPSFYAPITAVSATTITVNTFRGMGTNPTTAGAGMSIRVGGAWKGPNGAVGFPFGFANNDNATGVDKMYRFNFKNNAEYAVTAAMVHNRRGAKFQGYNTVPGDGGRAVINGGTTGVAYMLLDVATGAYDSAFEDMEFANNGATGTAQVGVRVSCNSNGGSVFIRCVFRAMTKDGFFANNLSIVKLVECEAYGNNKLASYNSAGFSVGNANAATFIRCTSSFNIGANGTHGWFIYPAISVSCIDCIASSNDGFGVCLQAGSVMLSGCDIYNNIQGIFINGSTWDLIHIENCNIVKSAQLGINMSLTTQSGAIINCAFGSGSQANAGGDIAVNSNPSTPSGLRVVNKIVYPANISPYVDAPNGDFRLAIAQAKGAGYGKFLQTKSGQSGTVSYPDIGAAQSYPPPLNAPRITGSHGGAFNVGEMVSFMFNVYGADGGLKTIVSPTWKWIRGSNTFTPSTSMIYEMAGFPGLYFGFVNTLPDPIAFAADEEIAVAVNTGTVDGVSVAGQIAFQFVMRGTATVDPAVSEAAARVLKSLPDATPAGNGGLPIQSPGPAGDGNVLSANVKVAASSRLQIVNDVWRFLTTDIAALPTTAWGRWIYDSLNKIYSKIAFFGSTSYKSMFAVRQGGRVDVTRGDDMTSATGVQYRFTFSGYPDVTGKTVKGQIVEMGGDVLHDNLPGGIELSGPDTSVDQIALVSIPEEVSAVLPPTDRADNFDLLCRIEYATGKWVEIGRVALDVLRG